MKRFLSILRVVILGACLAACGKNEQEGERQVMGFKSYLDSSPYVNELPCDTLDGLWRVLENNRPERQYQPMIEVGDELEFYFEGYTFFSSLNLDPTLGQRPAPFYTNRAEIIGAMGADPLLWPVDPVVARVGEDELFKGLDRGLQGAYRGDSLLLFIPAESGYGEMDMAQISKNTPLVFRIYVKDVR